MVKRLFVFAAYDKNGVVDNSLLHYLRSLGDLGDVIFTMDNAVQDSELSKVLAIKNVLSASAERHGEYDFGSYKRGYMYARAQEILENYDWVYFVNDSVYGPLSDLSPVLQDLEGRGADLIGMMDFENKPTPVQVQSWFVGVSKKVATSDFFADFMQSIKGQTNKQLVVLKYEVGLSQTVLRHGFSMSTYIRGENGEKCHSIYEKPIEILKQGVPFLKKSALLVLDGLQYLYPYTTEAMVEWIYENAVRNEIAFIRSDKYFKYRKCFRLTVFSVPILTIWRQKQESARIISYKGYIFDFIPIFKIGVSQK
jgi:lipopolysaccharide biosynthesis protein